MEKAGELFVVRPFVTILIKKLERNPEKLQQMYDLGILDAAETMGWLKVYLYD